MTRRQRPKREWKGRHGGRLEKHPAVREENGRLVWARDLKAGEEFAVTTTQLEQAERQPRTNER